MLNTWVQRIRLRMNELNLTQEELAIKLGLTRGAVTHYLAGRRVPPLYQFQKIAAILKTNPAWLQFGITSSNNSKENINTTSVIANYHPIPILLWECVTKMRRNRLKENKDKKNEYLSNLFTNQKNWYALRVKGDSMISQTGQKSFYDGDIIIVDPNKTPKHGDYVIAMLTKSAEATFKQYIIDGGIHYLKSINSQYPLIKIDSKCTIIGKVIGAHTEL